MWLTPKWDLQPQIHFEKVNIVHPFLNNRNLIWKYQKANFQTLIFFILELKCIYFEDNKLTLKLLYLQDNKPKLKLEFIYFKLKLKLIYFRDSKLKTL